MLVYIETHIKTTDQISHVHLITVHPKAAAGGGTSALE